MELKKNGKDKNYIEQVIPGSIAEELGIEKGDILLSINGNKIKDIIDYRFHITDEYIEVEIKKKDEEVWLLEIEKESYEDLGIDFTNPLIDHAKSCNNNCVFCFVNQLPKGMRETLYFKDDDSRLSFLQGNFITLTNLSDDEIDRIVRYRISPINVSVHTSNPELRIKMLNNKKAGKIMEILKKFSEVRLKINCQIVLVPGMNDGKELERTISDLSTLNNSIESVAVVPVGITDFREGLFKLKCFDPEGSKGVINLVKKLQKKYYREMGTRFVFLSDEFYITADEEVPSVEGYEGFGQIENGVGLVRYFISELKEGLKNTPIDKNNTKRYTIATGILAYDTMCSVKEMILNNFPNIELNVIGVENTFFGKNITVTGLLTGHDLIRALKNIEIGDYLLLSKSMFKQDEDILLDDITLRELEDRLNVKILVSDIESKEFIELFRV